MQILLNTPVAIARLALAGGILAVVSCGRESSPMVDVSRPHTVGPSKVDIGRYIITTSGCHDCHTPGALEGKLPQESDWFTGGEKLGWGGPWGTSYAPNLRLKFMGYPTEQEFVKAMRLRAASPTLARPPMPWQALTAMTDEDLGALWVYVRSLGAKGEAMPEPLPPGVDPFGPYIDMTPKMGKGRPPSITAPQP